MTPNYTAAKENSKLLGELFNLILRNSWGNWEACKANFCELAEKNSEQLEKELTRLFQEIVQRMSPEDIHHPGWPKLEGLLALAGTRHEWINRKLRESEQLHGVQKKRALLALFSHETHIDFWAKQMDALRRVTQAQHENKLTNSEIAQAMTKEFNHDCFAKLASSAGNSVFTPEKWVVYLWFSLFFNLCTEIGIRLSPDVSHLQNVQKNHKPSDAAAPQVIHLGGPGQGVT